MLAELKTRVMSYSQRSSVDIFIAELRLVKPFDKR
jgi:hypothetical protein